ncbi:MAG: dipeptidase [Actinomycetota bacterium]|nr:dipeptidase [Actinomycetota bacterium]
MVPFLDGHNDVLLSLHLESEGPQPFLDGRPLGHLDLARAHAGGFAAGLFAIFVPSEDARDPAAMPIPIREPPYAQPLAAPIDPGYARREAAAMIDLLLALESAADGQVEAVRDLSGLERCLAGEALGAILHFEGAEPVAADLCNFAELYARGLRSLGLVWSRPNAFAEGVPFAFPDIPETGPGLTAAGKELVREANRLGVMLDLSHLNERGFWDVAELSEAPLVASHSNVHALCANTRNLTDAQLDEIGRSGGIVGITFHAGMLGEDGRTDAAIPLGTLLDHVDYAVQRIGVDHVGFGSDFDGAVVIDELGDAAGLPRLVEALRDRGYGDEEVVKLAHANWLRVIGASWR